MRREQRPPAAQLDAVPLDELWQPILRKSKGDTEAAGDLVEPFGEDAWRVLARDGDEYVVVDDRDGNELVLISSAWPRVASDGWLVFPDDVEEHGVDGRQVQQVIDEHRRRVDQITRPLRIGDAFLRRQGDDGEDSWLDVTEAAREQAKIATLAAVVPVRREHRRPVTAGGVAGDTPLVEQAPATTNIARPTL
jgi:hypothetical protein